MLLILCILIILGLIGTIVWLQLEPMLLWLRFHVPHERYRYTVDRLLESRRAMDDRMRDLPDQSSIRSIFQDLIALLFNTTKYKAHPYQGEDEPECFISHETIKKGDMVITLPCGHSALAEPMKTWIKDHITCPICRYQC